MIRDVITYPNPKLRQVSKDVLFFNEELHILLDDMYETMIDKRGIGLAAVQVAILLNVLIINLPKESDNEDNESVQLKDDLLEFINPTILELRGICINQEGCLSIPDVFEDIERAQWIKIKYFDRFGKEYIKEYDGLMAIALQHEIDHLRGHLFIEKLSYFNRQKFEKEWKKNLKNKKN